MGADSARVLASAAPDRIPDSARTGPFEDQLE
jgi:hypothetical protein